MLRLLLALSVWDGPVLWGHVHTDGQKGLDTHVARFHACDQSPWTLGWHWHITVPAADDEADSDGQPTRRSEHTVVLLTSSSTETAPQLLAWSIVSSDDWLTATQNLGGLSATQTLAVSPTSAAAPRLTRLSC